MKYFENAENGHILSISTNYGQTEISEERYNSIVDKAQNFPKDAPSGYVYQLRVSDLEWELVEYTPEPPDPDPELSDDEMLDILLGGDGT